MTEYKFDAELLEYIQTFQSRIEYVKWDFMCVNACIDTDYKEL